MTSSTTTTSNNSTKRQLTGAAKAAHAKAQEAAKAKRSKRFEKIAIFTAVAIIAVIAGQVSYMHLRDLAILAGQDHTYPWSPANTLPITVDLMMIVASFKLRNASASFIARLIARLSMVTGLIVSMAGNVAAQYLVDPNADMLVLRLIVSGWPVVPLLAATEMLTHHRKDVPSLIKRPSSKEAAKAKAPKASGRIPAQSTSVTRENRVPVQVTA